MGISLQHLDSCFPGVDPIESLFRMVPEFLWFIKVCVFHVLRSLDLILNHI